MHKIRIPTELRARLQARQCQVPPDLSCCTMQQAANIFNEAEELLGLIDSGRSLYCDWERYTVRRSLLTFFQKVQEQDTRYARRREAAHEQ